MSTGVFSTAQEAITACKTIVDDDLEQLNKPGMTVRSDDAM